jgi:dienelactone hydrolase
VYFKWLDKKDELRAQRGEEAKRPTPFQIDAHLAFSEANQDSNIEEFCAYAQKATDNPFYFSRSSESVADFKREGDWLTFTSDIETEVDCNNVAWVRVTESGSKDKVLIVFHHWNANKWQDKIAKLFSRRGVTVVEMAMPYHFQRSRPGSDYADYMLSANLGRTVQSVRQGVLDGRKLIQWLKHEGYGEITVLGMSLGSWVGGLLSAHDNEVNKSSLYLTAGSMADLVWNGRATRSIRQSLEGHIDLETLRKAWMPLNTENYAHRLARDTLDLDIVLGKRDTVVLPAASHKLIESLKLAGAGFNITEYNCGHYSLGMPQYIARAALKLNQQLSR